MADDVRLRRARVVRIYDTLDTTVVLGSDGRAHELRAESAQLAKALLQFLLEPRSRGQIAEHLAALTGGTLDENGVVDQLIGLLLEAGAIDSLEGKEAPSPPRRHERLVLCISGAVAAMYAPQLISQLLQRGFQVRVAATKSALRFINAFAIETLLHHPIAADLFDGTSRVPHIDLAKWADVVLVWPATATTLSRLATGNYDSLVSAIALTTSAPVIVAPSMNSGMYAGAAVQRNIDQLTRDGMHIVHPAFGVEVADRPSERVPELGAAPPVGVVAQMVETALAFRRAQQKHAPSTASEWDELYSSAEPEQLPWHSDEADLDLIGALDRFAAEPRAVLDIGTGLGQVAVKAAERGHQVVAIDLSDRALENARRRAPDAAVVWLRDDIIRSHLRGQFAIAIDRGCLHLLPPEAALGYAENLARLVAPGGLLLLKTHACSEGDRHGTTPYGRQQVERLLGDAFELVEEHPSKLPGPSQAPAATLFVLRRIATPKQN
jgi:SAM-dependent methyltransferase